MTCPGRLSPLCIWQIECGVILFSSLANSVKKFFKRAFTSKLKLKKKRAIRVDGKIIIIFIIDNYLLSYFEPMRVWPQRFWFLEVFFLSPRPNCSDRQIELVCGGQGVPLRSYPRLLPTAALMCFLCCFLYHFKFSLNIQSFWMGHSNLIPSHPSSGYKSAHMTCSHRIFCQVTCDPRSLDFLLSSLCISLCPLCLV